MFQLHVRTAFAGLEGKGHVGKRYLSRFHQLLHETCIFCLNSHWQSETGDIHGCIDMSSSLSPSERSYIITGLTHPTSPTRLDGRSLLTPRPISISYGDAPQANGSSRVVIGGGTEAVAGIRLEVMDVDPSVKGKGKEGWRGRVEVDVWVK